MINTKNIKQIPLSKDNILKYISEEDIFRKYIPHNFKIDEVFSAPYREDEHPSFGIYWNNHYNKLMFKDLGKKIGGDAFKYVQLLNNCNLWQACKIINNDFKLNLGGFVDTTSIIIKEPLFEPKIKAKRQISIDYQEFTEIDLKWWGDYSISLETLKKYNVFSVKNLYIDNKLKRVYTNKYPIYAYFFPRTGNYKIYIPNEDKWNKWDTNANNDWDIQGYDQLPETGNTIYLTKSMKDVMVLHELSEFSVATHGEGHWYNPDFLRHIQKRFQNIILLYDNDKSGIECTEKIIKQYPEYNLKYIFIPEHKDISGYIKVNGKENTKLILKQLNEK